MDIDERNIEKRTDWRVKNNEMSERGGGDSVHGQ